MPNYQKMYAIAFNAISDALEELDKLNIGMAKDYLKKAQIQTEELYISQDEEKPGDSNDPGSSDGSGNPEASAE